MLVCNVSLLRRRAEIAADIAEVTSALDAPGTGNVVFATLVDDPASVSDVIDAYLGEIMVEAANAEASLTAGSDYAAAIVEAATAVDTLAASLAASVTDRSAMLMGSSRIVVNTGTTARDANAAGVMINTR